MLATLSETSAKFVLQAIGHPDFVEALVPPPLKKGKPN
jgi:hypothetical protein